MEPTPSAVLAARALRVEMGRLRRRLRENYDRAELTASQTAVLGRLDRDGPATASALAAAERVRPQSIAVQVAALEERALVHRTPDPDDGRRQLVALTPAGRDFLRDARAAGEDWLAGVVQERLSEDERRALIEAMTLLGKVTGS
jgi:DNA-binding MarR family transcriptional regulator